MSPEASSRNHNNEIAPLPPADVEMAPIAPPEIPDKVDDPFLVTFNPSFDVDNPKDWPASRKWAVTDVLSATGFNRIMVSTIMAPALTTISRELHMNSIESMMALSIYLLATAFGPLVIGPLSEVYGRKRVLHASNVWFLVWNIVCGFAKTKEVLIAARFLAGFGASSIYALAGGVLGDVWRPEQRGRSLGIYLLIPLLGAAVGPIIGGFMAGRATWRWMFWSTSIFQAIMILVSFTAFRETYAPLILKRRAEQLRKDTGDSRYYTAHERMDSEKSVPSILTRALTRPVRMLVFHPVIQITALESAFYYGLLYIILSSFAELWTSQYHVSVELSGLHYIACAGGELIGAQIGAPVIDWYHRRMRARQPEGDLEPEHRIPLIFISAIFAPIGFLVYGWTAEYRVHWAAVDLGILLIMIGPQVGGMAQSAYIIDAYPDHTSSVMAATQFLRSLTAFFFPLFVPAMYAALGYGWGNTLIASLALVIGVPAPLVLWKWGKRLRMKATSTE